MTKVTFDQIPKGKPNNYSKEPGLYDAIIFKAEKGVGKTSGEPNIQVSFKLDEGGFVNEYFTINDKQFNLYKLGRLLEACNVELQGQIDADAIRKVILNKRVSIQVDMNDRGYPTVDFSGESEGIYPVGVNAKPEVEAEPELSPEVTEAIESDEDF